MSKNVLSFLFVLFPMWAYACDSNATPPFYEGNPYFGEGKAFTVGGVESFFEKLRDAVLNDDADWLKDNVRYPLLLKRNNTELLISSGNELLSNYNSVFNDVVKKAVQCQKFNELFANWQGIRVGNGAVWFTKVLRDEQKKDGGHGEAEGVSKVDSADAESAMNSMGDPSKWKYQIFAISDGMPVVNYVSSCGQLVAVPN